jgi:hypothetical protein
MKTTGSLSRHRGRPTIRNHQLSKDNFHGSEKNWSRMPDGGMIPEQTDRLTVGRKIALALAFESMLLVSLGSYFER